MEDNSIDQNFDIFLRDICKKVINRKVDKETLQNLKIAKEYQNTQYPTQFETFTKISIKCDVSQQTDDNFIMRKDNYHDQLLILDELLKNNSTKVRDKYIPKNINKTKTNNNNIQSQSQQVQSQQNLSQNAGNKTIPLSNDIKTDSKPSNVSKTTLTSIIKEDNNRNIIKSETKETINLSETDIQPVDWIDNKWNLNDLRRKDFTPYTQQYDPIVLESDKIITCCKEAQHRFESGLLKEFITKKQMEDKGARLDFFKQLKKDLNDMIEQKRPIMLGNLQLSKDNVNNTFCLKLTSKKNCVTVTVNENFDDNFYWGFFKLITHFIKTNCEDMFNKIEYKEVGRLLKKVNEVVDPSIDMMTWSYMSHFECCSADIWDIMSSQEDELIREQIYRKATFYQDMYTKEIFLKEFDYMKKNKRLCIPIQLSFRVINPKDYNKIQLKISRTISNKNFSKNVTMTIGEIDKFNIQKTLESIFTQMVTDNLLDQAFGSGTCDEFSSKWNECKKIIEGDDDMNDD